MKKRKNESQSEKNMFQKKTYTNSQKAGQVLPGSGVWEELGG
jgi:hypothetical protein